MVAEGGQEVPGVAADALGEAGQGQGAARKGPFRRVRSLFG